MWKKCKRNVWKINKKPKIKIHTYRYGKKIYCICKKILYFWEFKKERESSLIKGKVEKKSNKNTKLIFYFSNSLVYLLYSIFFFCLNKQCVCNWKTYPYIYVNVYMVDGNKVSLTFSTVALFFVRSLAPFVVF